MSRILVVDDDIMMRGILVEMLKRAGYDVVTASNGNEALAHLRKRTFHLIITDIVMPEKEGIETIREMRRDYPSSKIIAISGGGRIGPIQYLELAASLGADRTFVKPLDRKEMLAAVSELLGEDTGDPVE